MCLLFSISFYSSWCSLLFEWKIHSFGLSGDALYALRASLNASHGQLADWNHDQVSPCTWSKVTCDSDNNVVSV